MKYVGICSDCGKTVDNLNASGECQACIDWQNEQREKMFNNRQKKQVPDAVKRSKFGCMNCLWQSCECKGGSMYQPDGKNECKGYTYYD